MKKSINIIIIASLIFFGLISIIFKSTSRYTSRDNFVTANPKNKVLNDGTMTFNYLNDKNYDKTILDKYYQNDDTRINGTRVIYHPYQLKTGLFFGSVSNTNMGINKDLSNSFYNDYGIRI